MDERETAMGRRFTEEEERVLAAGGLRVDVAASSVPGPASAATAVVYGEIVAGALDVRGAAEALGIGEEGVRRRIARGALYAVPTQDGDRLPAFQFGGGGEVPGVGEVLRHLDRSLHPVEVVNWFTFPDPDLYLEPGEVPVSPREWLLAGGDPGKLAPLAGEL